MMVIFHTTQSAQEQTVQVQTKDNLPMPQLNHQQLLDQIMKALKAAMDAAVPVPGKGIKTPESPVLPPYLLNPLLSMVGVQPPRIVNPNEPRTTAQPPVPQGLHLMLL